MQCRIPFGVLSTTRVLPTRNRRITSFHQVLTRGVRKYQQAKAEKKLKSFKHELHCLAKGSRRCNETYL